MPSHTCSQHCTPHTHYQPFHIANTRKPPSVPDMLQEFRVKEKIGVTEGHESYREFMERWDLNRAQDLGNHVRKGEEEILAMIREKDWNLE